MLHLFASAPEAPRRLDELEPLIRKFRSPSASPQGGTDGPDSQNGRAQELCRVLENLKLITRDALTENGYVWATLPKTHRLLTQFLSRVDTKTAEKNPHESLILNVIRMIKARGTVSVNDLARFVFRGAIRVSASKKQKLHFVLKTLEALELIRMERAEGSRREMIWRGVDSMVDCVGRMIEGDSAREKDGSRAENGEGGRPGAEDCPNQRIWGRLVNRTLVEYDQTDLNKNGEEVLVLPRVNVAVGEGTLLKLGR